MEGQAEDTTTARRHTGEAGDRGSSQIRKNLRQEKVMRGNKNS